MKSSIFSETDLKDFTESESTVFEQLTRTKDVDSIVEIIEAVIKKTDDEAEQIFRLAESIRTDFVESCEPIIEKLNHDLYQELLYKAIYSLDYFKISKSLLHQFKDYRKGELIKAA